MTALISTKRLREAADLGRELVSRSRGAGLLVVDADLRIQAIAGETYASVGDEDGVGRRVRDVIPAAAWQVLAPRYQAAIGGEAQSFEYDSLTDGSVYSLRMAPIRDGVLVIGLVVLSENVTAWIPAANGPADAKALVEIRRLAKEEERLRAAHEVARLASWELDPDTEDVQVFQALPGDAASVGDTITFEDLLRDRSAEERDEMRSDLAAARGGKLEDSVRRSARARPKGTVWLETRSRAVRDDDGRLVCIRGTTQDVTDQELARREAATARDYLQAVADSIGEGLLTTDAEGRVTYVNEAAERLLGWSSEHMQGKNLHEVVHPYDPGQPAHCAEGCPIRVRPDARRVRVEDDLFACRGGRPLPVAYTVSSFETDDGVQGGVVVFGETSERMAHEEELIREAGKLKWIARIQDALAEDRFMLYAQPIVDLRSDEVTTYELLLRMRAPDGTVVPPGEYLPVAEQYGLIGDIDRWVIGQGVSIAASGTPVQMNLSARSIGDDAVLDHIEACLNEAGADPANVVFEITETAILSADSALARIFVERLCALGCKVALDDFGTGYGGFTHVKQLPVDELKIDMQFVRDLITSPASRHVVKAVVSLAEDFDLKVVAEGVEDAATYDLLRDLGVDFAQGYHIARPGPLHEMLPHGRTETAPAGDSSPVVSRMPAVRARHPAGDDRLDPDPPPESPAILVVDDYLAKRLAISSSLEPLGYPVVDVESGEAALREVVKRQFAVIIMDVRMPVMDGFETTTLIRQRENAEHTPIIFMTSHTSDELAVPAAYATGAVDFLFAPIDPETLRAKVKVFVELFVKSRDLERSVLEATVISDGFREREVRFDAAQSLARLGSWEWTPEGDHLECSEELVRALARDGLEHPTSLREYAALVHSDDRTGWEQAVRRARAGRATESEYRVRRPDGSDRWLQGRRAVTIGPDGIERVHGTVQDISRRKAIEEQLEQTANRDPLTDLSNRRGFEYDFGRTLAYATRYERSGAVLVVDLDGFKAVNDTLGHQAGDGLLLGIAACLRNRLRESDLIGRMGGDEFAVVLSEVTEIEAARVAEDLRQLVREQGLATSDVGAVTASIGIAPFDGDSDQKELLNRADQAMYQAKRDGGNRVQVEAPASAKPPRL